MARMVATTRIVMPKAVVRLSAGRTDMSDEGQALCFLAGASSIFAGDKLLTTPNPDINEDKKLFNILGLQPKAPFVDSDQPISNEGYKAMFYLLREMSSGIDLTTRLRETRQLLEEDKRKRVIKFLQEL